LATGIKTVMSPVIILIITRGKSDA